LLALALSNDYQVLGSGRPQQTNMHFSCRLY